MAGEVESTSSVVLVRSWRTAFLTLRDETQSQIDDTRVSVVPLLNDLVFVHLQSFIDAARSLPPHEVSSDLMFLLKLVALSDCADDDTERALSLVCYMVHSITFRVSLVLSSSDWSEMLASFGKMVKFFIEYSVRTKCISDNSVGFKATKDCLETTRHLISLDPRRCSISENIKLVEFLLDIIACCHSALHSSYQVNGDLRCHGGSGNNFSESQLYSFWKVRTTAFTMVSEAFTRVGSSFPVDTWHSVIETLRKVLDTLAGKMFVVEDGVATRFFCSVLHCLHLVLVNRKGGSLSDHLAAFVATLRTFLAYGTGNQSLLLSHGNKDPGTSSRIFSSRETPKKDVGAYRPPHLRRRASSSHQQTPKQTMQTSSDHDTYLTEFSSSDSDYSDSDGGLKDFDNARCCKVRVAAISCIQDLCEADPKAFISQWTMLLPTNDVLQPRKYEATLMTCLLFDPFLKARLASASAIAAMLEEPSSVSLQVAEYKESTKCGSYMALSSSLGLILMQLHVGVLHLIQHERHTGLLTSLFKILMLLISSTPYVRMPEDLLPKVLSSLELRIEEGFPFKSDQTSLLTVAISCLTAAVSTSPPSSHVNKMFEAEISRGISLGKGGSGVLITLLHHAEQITNPTICLEALQALKAICHNYPDLMAACWKRILSIVYEILRLDTVGLPYGKGAFVRDTGSTMEKVVSAAIKVLDECLRAVSGFKGTEDLFGDRLVETPFVSDFVRDKKISSAPSYVLETTGISGANLSGTTEWSEAIQKHIAISICHVSGMVRAASITCFAGITCAVFSNLKMQQQQFILSSCINAANDSVASVRAAACRAIGVIVFFPEILSAEIAHKFINAVEVNTRGQPVPVRVTASWAMANVCDSFSHSFPGSLLDAEAKFQLLVPLLECSLKLTADGDKIKSNAVRALGNLSRVIPFANPLEQGNCRVICPGISNMDKFSRNCTRTQKDTVWPSNSIGCIHLLEKIVQAFLSCITTGNVKVQWNVCHALSNLFLNESLKMQRMEWASSVYSILLLLLRDSSNFKIRIQAAAALAVPSTVLDYGRSFSDVVQGIQHILENVAVDQPSTPSFKYRVALEKQLTASMLHVLGLCSSSSHERLKEFLLKKAYFIENWLKDLCSSLEARTEQDGEVDSYRNPKRDLVYKAIQSLIEVYESTNQSSWAQKLEKLMAACG